MCKIMETVINDKLLDNPTANVLQTFIAFILLLTARRN